MHAPRLGSGADVAETANDRLKRRSGSFYWGGLLTAVLAHFLLFAFWPTMSTAATPAPPVPTRILGEPAPPPPPPPPAIRQPAAPDFGGTDVDPTVTIPATDFGSYPPGALTPPPTSGGGPDISNAPVFTPMTVRPRLTNSAEVSAALQRNYPPLLKDAGIGGTVLVWFFIDENGRVVRTLVKESSGRNALDDAALRVAGLMRFTPALNRDKRVPVWVAIPISFRSSRFEE